MPHPPARRVATVLAALLLPTVARAQGLPGSQPHDAPGSYTRLVRAGVDSTLRRWTQAAEARDGAALARLYTPAAAIYPTYGNPIHGRRAIGDALAQAVTRIARPRFTIDRLDASGDLASVIAELTYDVALATGGSYERRERVQLALSPHWPNGWTIETQAGGDLAPRVTWVVPPRATLAAGQSDTVTVRVTDALGGGIPDVLVAFDVAADAVTISPAAARTNARGEAVAVRTAARGGAVGELRVTAAIAPEDALLAPFSTAGAPEERPARADRGGGPQ